MVYAIKNECLVKLVIGDANYLPLLQYEMLLAITGHSFNDRTAKYNHKYISTNNKVQ